MKDTKKSKTTNYSFKRVLLSKKSYAKKFSEKDENLYNLLMTCFDRKIETVECCAGHEEDDCIKKPYIMFRLNASTKSSLEGIITGLDKTSLIITFSINKRGHKKVTIKTLDKENHLFERIEKLIENKPSEIDKEAARVFHFVTNLKGKSTNVKMIYNEDGVKYYVNTSDDNILSELEKKLFKNIEADHYNLNILR